MGRAFPGAENSRPFRQAERAARKPAGKVLKTRITVRIKRD